jgi:hypothetical protein
MTVNSLTNISGAFYGNGITTVFSYGFKIFAASELRVVKSVAGVETNAIMLNIPLLALETMRVELLFLSPRRQLERQFTLCVKWNFCKRRICKIKARIMPRLLRTA